MSVARRLLPAGALATALMSALPAALPAALADDKPMQSVEVTALKDPEMGAYRNVAAGLDVFEREHGLAPKATLRFHVMRAEGGSATAEDGLVLKLVGEDGAAATLVPIGADGTFAVERSQAAWDADATFILNRRSGLYHTFPEVRTPGLPDHVRRLGDLRLQCRVMVAIAKERMSFLSRAAVNTLMLGAEWCARSKVTWNFPATMRLGGATLRDGQRSLALQTSEWRYSVPIGDTAWPDDALVELSAEQAAR